MKPMRKFTSRSFEKRMPRTGGKVPKMPKIKKFQEGGESNELVPRSMLPDRNAEQEAKDRKALMDYYTSDEVRERDRRRSKRDKKLAEEAIREMMRNPDFKGKGQRLGDLPTPPSRNRREEPVLDEIIVTPESSRAEVEKLRSISRRRIGGSIKKYDKGGKIDGCAVRGKTRGKYI